MNKELEALERIVDTYYIDNMDKEINIIETALKDYEQIENMCESYGIEFNMANIKEALFTLAQLKGEKGNNWENYNKKLKALEIIKEKPIVALVDYKYTYEEWLELVDEKDKDLFRNKEEYDLLKEVLL